MRWLPNLPLLLHPGPLHLLGLHLLFSISSDCCVPFAGGGAPVDEIKRIMGETEVEVNVDTTTATDDEIKIYKEALKTLTKKTNTISRNGMHHQSLLP